MASKTISENKRAVKEHVERKKAKRNIKTKEEINKKIVILNPDKTIKQIITNEKK